MQDQPNRLGFYVRLPRVLTDQERGLVDAAPDCEWIGGGYGQQNDITMSTIVVRAATADDAMRRVIDLLGLDEDEAAALAVRPVAT
jgi:hypothetical protein